MVAKPAGGRWSAQYVALSAVGRTVSVRERRLNAEIGVTGGAMVVVTRPVHPELAKLVAPARHIREH